MRRSSGKARVLAFAAVAGSVAALGTGAQPASALTDSFDCYGSSAQTCWSGMGYRGWIVIADSVAYSRSEVCAKGRTEAQNTRTGQGNGCNTNTNSRRTCFSTAEPPTAAYVYWAGSGSAQTNFGDAFSPSEYPAGC